jgi:heme-degrading monooxygenase HmoA
MYARVTNIRFPPNVKADVIAAAQGLTPVSQKQRGFQGLQVFTDLDAGEGIIVSLRDTEADAKTSEESSSYIGQVSMMSSFLYGVLHPKTYEVNVKT